MVWVDSVQLESDGGLRYLEQKLGIFIQGPAQTRRNAALDILTGRVADERLLAPEAIRPQPVPLAPNHPVPVAPTRIHPSFAYRTQHVSHVIGDALPAIDWSSRSSVSPWLAASDVQRPRLRIAPPIPPTTTSRSPRVRSLLLAAATVGLFVAVGFGVRSLIESGDVAEAGAPTRVAVAPELVVPSAASADGADLPIAAPEPVVASQPIAVASQPTAVASQPIAVASQPIAVASQPIAPASQSTVVVSQPTAPPASQPTPASANVLRVVLDDRFTSNTRAWPDDPQGPGWLAAGAYHLAASQVGQFVAVAIPGTQGLGDAVVTGWFRKVGGPAGGGYGLVLRDQTPEARDGRNQLGRYYVFEVGDRGDVGVWLRENDHWVDLLPWTPSDAVKPGTASNELTVTATGDRMNFVVNGIPVASQTDTVLRTGGAGVFVGGDSNQVALDRIIVSRPS